MFRAWFLYLVMWSTVLESVFSWSETSSQFHLLISRLQKSIFLEIFTFKSTQSPCSAPQRIHYPKSRKLHSTFRATRSQFWRSSVPLKFPSSASSSMWSGIWHVYVVGRLIESCWRRHVRERHEQTLDTGHQCDKYSSGVAQLKVSHKNGT